ncbi:glycosyltransferase family 2 protein [Phaeodactylibacter xiamenensis]|uniref:glycosyltransferase family 2 protein n=1 Tax=Phaeodactylibacter xiamenensis TaxID=1524460 RepID=UPI003CCC20FB
MKENEPLHISVICPVLNEEQYLDAVLSFISHALPTSKECFIIDGGSTDNTKDIFQSWQSQMPNLYWLDNPHKFVPFALNLAIPKCKGSFIVRLDAHSEYASDYFEQILNTFKETNADIVGGPTRTKGKTAFQKAVAQAICNPFAIGNSKVHDIDYRGYTDSVTFGAWRRDVFEAAGLFDETLLRNQDDEFHYRAKSLGFSVYQSPDIKLYYYPRGSAKGLFRQYYQYGLFKPAVLRKVKSEIKLRHLVPSLFVIYLLLLAIFVQLSLLFLLPLLFYLSFIVLQSLKMEGGGEVKLSGLVTFPCIHIGYGIGFIMGTVNKNPTL